MVSFLLNQQRRMEQWHTFPSRNAREVTQQTASEHGPSLDETSLCDAFQLIMFEDQNENTKRPSLVSKSCWPPDPTGESFCQRGKASFQKPNHRDLEQLSSSSFCLGNN